MSRLPTDLVGHGMCYAYQRPKIMRTEGEARAFVRHSHTGGCFKCETCGFWHLSKQDRKV